MSREEETVTSGSVTLRSASKSGHAGKAEKLLKSKEKKERALREKSNADSNAKCEEARKLLECEGRNSQPNHAKALAAIDAALELNPANPLAYCLRGNSYRDQGMIDEAIASYSSCITNSPYNVTALEGRAFCYEVKQQWERAIADYTSVLEVDDEDDHAYTMRGLCRLYLRVPGLQLDRESFAQVLGDFRSAIRLNEANYYAWCNLGRAYEDQQMLQEAVDAYSKAIVVKSDYHHAIFRRGCCTLALAQGVATMVSEEGLKDAASNVISEPPALATAEASCRGMDTMVTNRSSSLSNEVDTILVSVKKKHEQQQEILRAKRDQAILLQCSVDDFVRLQNPEDRLNDDPMLLVNLATCYLLQGDLKRAEDALKHGGEILCARRAKVSAGELSASVEDDLCQKMLGLRTEELTAARNKRYFSS